MEITNKIAQPRILGSFDTTLRKVQQDKARKEASVPCGDCNQCCKCGYDIPLSDSEAERLEHTVSASGAKILAKSDDNRCHYFIDSRCSIYAQRPQHCKMFDCRLYALGGVWPDKLISDGFQPFALTTKSKDEKVRYLSVIMATQAALESNDSCSVEDAIIIGIDSAKGVSPEAEGMLHYLEQNPDEIQKTISDLK